MTGVRAIDIAKDCSDCLVYKEATYRDAARILQATELPGYVHVPIVKSRQDFVLVGSVQQVPHAQLALHGSSHAVPALCASAIRPSRRRTEPWTLTRSSCAGGVAEGA
jgi:hypothetical protein